MANGTSLDPKFKGKLKTVAVFTLLLCTLLIVSIKLFPGRPAHSNGQRAPELEFTIYGAKKVSHLSDYRGKPVLLNFWAHWCEPCLVEMPSLKVLEQELGPRGLTVLAMHVDSIETDMIKDFTTDMFPSNLIFDFNASDLSAFQVRQIPITFLIDKQGKVAKVFTGAYHWADRQIVDELTQYL